MHICVWEHSSGCQDEAEIGGQRWSLALASKEALGDSLGRCLCRSGRRDPPSSGLDHLLLLAYGPWSGCDLGLIPKHTRSHAHTQTHISLTYTHTYTLLALKTCWHKGKSLSQRTEMLCVEGTNSLRIRQGNVFLCEWREQRL